MTRSIRHRLSVGIVVAGSAAAGLLAQSPARVTPSSMARVGKVDDRFQSYNVEMVEVTGGRFWAPYKAGAATAPAAPVPSSNQAVLPQSLSAASDAMFTTRRPIDLYDARLRKMAAALAPAYVRVSGSWANATYFHDSDDPAPTTPPKGFNGVLTRAQWKGVLDFSRAVDAKLISSFAGSEGVRDANGVWTPAEAQKLLAYTRSLNAEIGVLELFNEPNQGVGTGQATSYAAASYGRDFKVFLPFIRKAAPNAIVLGPGSSGEESSTYRMKSEDLMAAAGPGVDAFSYHFYGARAIRCSFRGPEKQTTAAEALSEDWLSKTDRAEAYYRNIRDQFAPGKPIWLTETGGASCGGNPWNAAFLDTFRYLDQLGRLAKRGVQVVAHNTLAASDYALIDQDTLAPRPDYWGAVLWRKLMDATVLDAGSSGSVNVHLYAHCLRGISGGVAVLAINTDPDAAHEIALPLQADRYTLTAQDALGRRMDLNGSELKLTPAGDLPAIVAVRAASGVQRLPPTSISFFAVSQADNAACRSVR
jgi:heparanase